MVLHLMVPIICASFTLQTPEATSCGGVKVGFSTTREIVIETDGFVTVCVELLNGIPGEEVEAAIISSDGSAIGVCGMSLRL